MGRKLFDATERNQCASWNHIKGTYNKEYDDRNKPIHNVRQFLKIFPNIALTLHNPNITNERDNNGCDHHAEHAEGIRP